MMSRIVDINTAHANLADLLSLLSADSEIVLTQGNTPVAYLLPATEPKSSRIPGLHPGAIQTSDDFDQPLPDTFWTGNS